MRLLVVAALAVAALAVVTRLRLEPSAVVPADAGSDVFSGERALATLRGIVGDHPVPHPVGTAEHDRVADRIVAALQHLGYQPRREARTSCSPGAVCAPISNIVAELAGTTQDPPIDLTSAPPGGGAARPGEAGAIVATAHYDSVAISPGVSDDGASCAALLEIAAAAQRSARRRAIAIVLLFSDGEELGLLGARAFASHSEIAAGPYTVVNVESRGVDGASLMFQTSHANNALIHAFASAPHPIAAAPCSRRSTSCCPTTPTSPSTSSTAPPASTTRSSTTSSTTTPRATTSTASTRARCSTRARARSRSSAHSPTTTGAATSRCWSTSTCSAVSSCGGRSWSRDSARSR